MSLLASYALATNISTAAQLANISSNLSDSYTLTADINLSGTSWTPLGDSTTPFTGSFDGAGHTISSLSVSSGSEIGLFGVTSGATIGNVILTDADIGGSCSSDIEYAGLLVGKALSSVLYNISVSGDICGVNDIGGLVGYANDGNITNSASNVNILTYETATLTNSVYIGGLVGEANATLISKNVVSAEVNATTSKVVGGVIGTVYDTDAYMNSFEGSVYGTGNVGGVIGSMENGSVYDSYAIFNNVLAAGTSSGVLGSLYGSGSRIYNTYSAGVLVKGYQAGGVLGVVDTSTANSNTVYCNAALNDTIEGTKNPLKPGYAKTYNVFNNDNNNSTPVYGQTNFSIDTTHASDYNDTVVMTDYYSSGYDGLGVFVTQTNSDYVELFNDAMPGICDFNSNSVWNSATINDPYPTLIGVGPSF